MLAALAMTAAAPDAQREPSTKDVMRRVERYVASYGEKASIFVCSERYLQGTARSADDLRETRTLISDFAIVRADAIRGWMGFRDVLDVDGRRVRDREDRLLRVLMASQGSYDEARRLSDESSRYNIGSIERNFNVPTAALFFFVPDNHDRFRFSSRGPAGDGAWAIAFSEGARPTLIRTPEGRSIASAGTLHVLPETGVVVRTQLTIDADAGGVKGTGSIDVRYARVEALDTWLPASMDEAFEMAPHKGAWSRVTGHAEYSNCRQFTTSARIR